MRNFFLQKAGRMFRPGLLVGWLATLAAVPGYGANLIINHTNWDWYLTQPQAVHNAVAGQKIFFAHASVGGNILQGFSESARCRRRQISAQPNQRSRHASGRDRQWHDL